MIYPDTLAGFPLCEFCFRRTDDLAATCDPRITPAGQSLSYTCAVCYHARAAGQTLALPAGPELEETWEQVARLTANGEIPAELTARALETLAPHLTRLEAEEALEVLQTALRFQQEVHDGDTTEAEVESELAHPDRLAAAAQRWVDNALQVLMEAAS